MLKSIRENAKIVIISAITSLLFSTGGFAIASAYITSADIKDETITNKDIANYTIGYKKLRSSSVNTYKIANYSIKGIDVKNRSIPLNKLTANVAPANHTHAVPTHTHAYAPAIHDHDSRYYTVSEVNALDNDIYDYVDFWDIWILDYIDIWHTTSVRSLEAQGLKAEAESLREELLDARDKLRR